MSCPWGKIQAPEPVNFEEIMSEQVARDLQDKEDQKSLGINSEVIKESDLVTEVPQDVQDNVASSSAGLNDGNSESDAMIARMLQMQFDKEHDENLKLTEEKYNGGSKVSISFDNYRRATQNFDFESDDEEEEIVDINDRKDWDRFDAVLRKYDEIPACGYKREEDGSLVTQHDVTMCARKNACKLLSFPPNFNTGDGENFDLKLSNRVFNSLRRYSQQADKRRYKAKDKKDSEATVEFGVDEFTRLLMFKLVNNGTLENVNGTISIGKEAVILHAGGNPNNEEHPTPLECVIKVFKTTLSEFKQRDKYIKDDHRFKDRIGNKTSRKSIALWAEKEMHNLNRLKNAGIPCPEVVVLKCHILVMSFIGRDGVAAPKLKHTNLSDADNILAYEQTIEAMKTLFHKANLVHADLSEYNILWFEDQCYFIDVSQAVLVTHENAMFFLHRDCTNIVNFFKKRVAEVHTPDELFELITGVSYLHKLDLLKLQESFKMKPHLVDRPGIESTYNFQDAWQKSQEGKEKESVEPVLVESPLA